MSATYGPVRYHGFRKQHPPSSAEGFAVIDGAVYTFYDLDGTASTTPFQDPADGVLAVWWLGRPTCGASTAGHQAAAAWLRAQETDGAH